MNLQVSHLLVLDGVLEEATAWVRVGGQSLGKEEGVYTVHQVTGEVVELSLEGYQPVISFYTQYEA